MRRLFLVASLVLSGSSAVAQPDAPATPCSVTIARAPDDVRAVIEAWVSNEPHCGPSLELRVVPTDDGYYLFARTGEGRIYERVVPDGT
ncbi:MAG: hypothetical protein AB7O24_03245 [Kofleriaceae bacterium]